MTLYEIRNGNVTFKRVIDDTIGALEKVTLEDLNNDNSLQIVVNSHLGDDGGALYAYEIPDDYKNGNFTKHKLASGFPVSPCKIVQSAN